MVYFSSTLWNWQIQCMTSGQNPYPGDMRHSQIPVGCTTPPPLGLGIERCISSSQTHSVHHLCQTVDSLAVVLLISTLTLQIRFVELSFRVFHNFWKLEWQDLVISSQLVCIFIDGKRKAIQLVNARVIVQTVLLPFYFLNTLQSDINSNRVYVLGHKYVLGPTQTHFSPSR